MNTRNPNPTPAFDDDALPPPDWDPAVDADESWSRLVTLMEKADAAPTLPAADAEGLRAALREQLTAEGLLGGEPRAEEGTSLFAWFRVLLLGGGAGGQMVRLGVVAVLAAAGTLQYGDDTSGTTLASRPRTAMKADARDHGARLGAKDAELDQIAGAPGAPPRPVAATKESFPQEAPALAKGVEDKNENIPAAAPAEQGVAQRADEGLSFQAQVEESKRQEPGRANVMQDSDAPRSRSRGPAGQTGSLQATAGGQAPASGELLAQAIEALQVAKVTAGLTSSASSLGELRYVERALFSALSQASVDSADMQVVVQALERYSRAEELAEAGRHADAEAAFREAHAGSRDSFVGFLSMFQMARLRFENTQDYAGALAAYRSLLEDYPRQFMTDEYRTHVRERVELLNRTAADNWADLRLWTEARSAPTPAAAADALVALLSDYPTSSLAPDAAIRLSELLVEDAAPQSIGYPEATRALAEAVRRREDGPNTARVQFALAEAIFRRGLEPDRAIVEYQRALEMKPAADLRAVIVERLKSAASARIAPSVEPVPAQRPSSQ